MANKNNNKGFSLVELLVVVVIMGIAVSIVTGSFISMYNARSKKATETLDAVIAQAKVDAMSGRDCRAVLEYSDGSDGNDEGYYALLLMRTDQDGDGVLDTSTEYKRESLGNDRLSFTVNGNDE
ncbi:MAG: prepilin-type N-terminal cleavage/methylation domain-containing protein, partial [Clostridia bacterium]|nr:prepilin-type N-terminal cleavage/methylation domain-containing protein [Clostridia bacterium]